MAKLTAKDNTVSSKDQMRNATEIYYLGNPNAPLRILILGNSITRHGPLKEIFWENDYGMAASCKEKDYVHLLYKELQDNGIDAYFMVRQASNWERYYRDLKLEEYCPDEHTFNADIVLFNLGENISNVLAKEDEAILYTKMQELFDYVGNNVIIANSVWENKYVDECFLDYATKNNKRFIDLHYVGENPSKYLAIGKFKHQGVSNHPGDEGMLAIEKEFYTQIRNLLKS